MSFPYRPYRLVMNILARAMRALMRARGVEGMFCVGRDLTFYEWSGMRFTYSYSQFGVGGDIDAGGNTEAATRAHLHSRLKRGTVFYDIGAHEGLFSISVKRHFPDVIVHAFEPHPAALEVNLVLNKLGDVAVHRVAVGERSASVTMTTNERSSNHVEAIGGDIKMVAIDQLIDDGTLPPPNIIKLDIEGFEYKALLGARKTLSVHHPVIVTEINKCILRYHDSLIPFFNYMMELGYTPHALNRGQLLSFSGQTIRQPAELPPSDDANYWWLHASEGR